MTTVYRYKFPCRPQYVVCLEVVAELDAPVYCHVRYRGSVFCYV
jgi:hypothetical protein